MHMIELSHICKRFGEKEVLDDISITIEKGEIFTFIGPSGTGKSTLLRLINLLDTPTRGSVLFDGRDTAVSERDKVRIRRRMSMVFQKPVALKGSVYEKLPPGEIQGISSEELANRVPAGLELGGLNGYESVSNDAVRRGAAAGGKLRGQSSLTRKSFCSMNPLQTSTRDQQRRLKTSSVQSGTGLGTTIIRLHPRHGPGPRLATRIAVVRTGQEGRWFLARHIL